MVSATHNPCNPCNRWYLSDFWIAKIPGGSISVPQQQSCKHCMPYYPSEMQRCTLSNTASKPAMKRVLACPAIPKCSRLSKTVCRASQGNGAAFKLSTFSNAQSTVRPAQQAHEPQGSGSPLVGVAVIGVAAAFIWKKLQPAGSLSGLEDRGYLDQNRNRKDVLNDVMKNVNTVPMPSLSDDQISAARARRQKERANHKLKLEDIELPENHPWATKANPAQQDGERVRARMPRRGPGGASADSQAAGNGRQRLPVAEQAGEQANAQQAQNRPAANSTRQ